jgi:hypothetical protein
MMVLGGAAYSRPQEPSRPPRIVAVTLSGRSLCVCCDTPLTIEEGSGAPQMYSDHLCSRCLQWVGRVLVSRLGMDPDVAHIGTVRPRRRLLAILLLLALLTTMAGAFDAGTPGTPRADIRGAGVLVGWTVTYDGFPLCDGLDVVPASREIVCELEED